jgi:hypothetical protein
MNGILDYFFRGRLTIACLDGPDANGHVHLHIALPLTVAPPPE